MTRDTAQDVPAVPQPQSLALRLQQLAPREPDESALRYVARLMEMLPEPSQNVVEKLTEAILQSDGPMAENEFWDGATLSSKTAIGRRFVFRSVHIQPTDHKDAALPFYLVCEVLDLESGEETVLSTGAVNVVTSLVRAQLVGGLPWEAEIVGPRRPLRSGRVPLHLRWIARIVQPDQDGADADGD